MACDSGNRIDCTCDTGWCKKRTCKNSSFICVLFCKLGNHAVCPRQPPRRVGHEIMLFVREPVSDFVKDQTGIYAAIETSVSSFVEEKTQEIQAEQAQLTDKVIDSLNLPDVLTKSLEQSNSKAVYEQRGIQNIVAYITGWLTDLAFEAVCCIISFVVVWILLRIVTMVLAGIVRLPVLHQIDCIAGAICGLCTALIIIWIGGIVVTAFAAQDWGREALSMITQSTLLTFLYNNNFLLNALLKAVR